MEQKIQIFYSIHIMFTKIVMNTLQKEVKEEKCQKEENLKMIQIFHLVLM